VESHTGSLDPHIRSLVVHVVTSLAIGGMEKVILDLVRFRSQNRFETRVVCLDESGVLQRGFTEAGVAVDTMGTSGSVPSRVLRLSSHLKHLQADVVHTHNPQAHMHGAIAARLAGVPVIIHTKHGRGYPSGLLLGAFNRLATRLTTRFVTVSQDAAEVARNVDRVAAEKLLVIQNGIDVDRFAFRPPNAAGTPVRAITVGRLDPIKDQLTLLRATRLVVDRAPSFHLDIVGDGPSRAELEAARAALGLTEHVTFVGYQEQVAPFLAKADFFVLSSISEGVSIALLEAMAMGLPAVATDVGGNREVVVPGVNGSLVPAKSPEALGEAMDRMQTETDARQRMSRAARHRVESQFSLRSVVARYEDLYTTSLQISRKGLPLVG
jgi:sugar transferase (PEP-CTERM/EpsH1 system associated)